MKTILTGAFLNVLFLQLAFAAGAPEQIIPTTMITNYKYYAYNSSSNVFRIDGMVPDQGRMYIASGTDGIVVIDPESGAVLQKQTIQGFELTGIAADSTSLYVTFHNRNNWDESYLGLFNKTTLQLSKKFEIPDSNGHSNDPSGLAVANNIAYVTTGSEQVLEMDLQTGKLLKAIVIPAINGYHTNVSAPALDGHVLYFSHFGLVRCDLTTGEITEYPRVAATIQNGMTIGLPEFPGQPVVVGNKIYLADDDHGVGVIDKATGKLLSYINAQYDGERQPMRGDRIQVSGNRGYVSGPFSFTAFTLPSN